MNQQQIELKAAQWLALRDSDRWTPQDEARLEQWLDESTAHTVMFIRVEAAWRKADRFKALGAGFAPDVVPTPEQFNMSSAAGLGVPGHRMTPAGARELPRGSVIGIAASLAAVVVIVVAMALSSTGWPFGPSYRTAVGGVASVPMKDGSTITLNTDSEVRVEVTDTSRTVELKQGEAFFDVAPDTRRPFVVNTGSKRVVVLGTKFSVRRLHNDIRVTVTEGRVRVEGADPQDAVELIAGDVAKADKAGTLVQSRPLAQVQESLSWRAGYVVLWDADLREAVAEFNRYNSRKLVLEDAGLAGVRLSGKFKATNVDAFVRLLEDGFGIRAAAAGDTILLQRM